MQAQKCGIIPQLQRLTIYIYDTLKNNLKLYKANTTIKASKKIFKDKKNDNSQRGFYY